MKSTFSIKTFGCKANLSDSQQIEAGLIKSGLVPSDTHPDVLVFNSCAVTDQAEKELRYSIRKAKRDFPNAKVLVTGCSAEINPSQWKDMKEVEWVLGNQDKARFTQLFQNNSDAKVLGSVADYSQFLSRHPMDREWPTQDQAFSKHSLSELQISKRHRAFLKIQEGCNSFCTFCIIPYGRGPSRSLPETQVIHQIHQLETDGFEEVVFTGTNIGEYGTDLDSSLLKGEGFAKLLKRVLSETSLKRFRLSSLDPLEITDELLEIVATEPRLCPHFHVSLQSSHSEILRKMKRSYSSLEASTTLDKIRKISQKRSSLFVGMDVITGFPGESLEIFEESKRFLSEWFWTRLHVFPYSERKGTPATRLPGTIPWAERVERAKELNRLSQERLRAHYQAEKNRILAGNRELEGLIPEGQIRVSTLSEPQYLAHTPHYLRVILSEKFKNSDRLTDIEDIEIIEEKHSNDFLMRIFPRVALTLSD